MSKQYIRIDVPKGAKPTECMTEMLAAINHRIAYLAALPSTDHTTDYRDLTLCLMRKSARLEDDG